ncbi:MAG: ATP:cob(I)alamin adenosyltransferase, partial [Singulisphaera sp.]
MKIYTKSGDDGSTGLLSNRRVGKDDPRIEAYGTIDELNAVLGIARAEGLDDAADAQIRRVQDDLF